MEISSMAFSEGTEIPIKYTCDGENISPPLKITDVPEGTRSLALVVDDPDAPSGDFVHWVLWNINPKDELLNEGIKPEGSIEGMSDAGSLGYTGPCPPSGVHRYRFTVYALDDNISVESRAIKEDLEVAMDGHIIEEDTLTGVYSRKSDS